ncbi:DMT family transporter [Sporolactobacillus putidus]|uniref:Multidrug resistance efflux transporter family protein n=1 Tax=Sporolactobacillus putidus TaxID=492735 RepID=A0A917SAX2_9BACL|nr:multidrug resistance efflux transporter family protein [Sporolactobacillus putidus]GGL65511.1 hypothetical protein GCM10007968_31880 [Sporolactobacillus putidus]
MRSIFFGVAAAFFFAVTFIVNRAMALSGGNWIWSGSLRYFFMVPFLLLIVGFRRNLGPLIKELLHHPLPWLAWSTVGFGLFYAPLCFAANYGPGWLIAGTWQLTIICGSLLSPLFFETIQTDHGPLKIRGRIPLRGLLMSLIILAGVVLMQWGQARHTITEAAIVSMVSILVAAFSYPLGNRKMMAYTGRKWDTFQRVLGMTLASMPFWLALSVWGIFTDGLPSFDQTLQSVIVAISSGVIATVLFFYATELTRGDIRRLAAVEATQSMEVVFTLLGELILLGSPIPPWPGWLGMAFVIVGMILHSYVSQKGYLHKKRRERAAEQ